MPCSFSGTPTPSFVSWTFDSSKGSTYDTTIRNSGGRYTIDTSSTGSRNLTITGLLFTDEGRYTCTASSAAGENSASVSVDVFGGKQPYIILALRPYLC